MSKYYTGKGDKGSTSIMAGKKVSKADPIIDAIGDTDELNSYVGTSLFYVRNEFIRGELKSIQNDLFSIGAILASASVNAIHPSAKIDKSRIELLELAIKEMDSKLPELVKFVLPGGSEEASHLQVARAIARRTERKVVIASKEHEIEPNVLAYLNRLSSFLFTAALYLNHLNGVPESHPIY